MVKTLQHNIKNKAWWVALISALTVLCKIWGIDLTDYIGKDWLNTVNSIATLGVLFGISVNTTEQTIGNSNEGVTTDVVQENQPIETTTTVEQTLIPNITEQKLEQIKTILNQ